MKNHLKNLSLILVLTLAFSSCSKNELDTPVVTKLISVKYAPNKIKVKEKAPFNGTNVVLNPKKISVKFYFSKFLKDKKKFVNPKTGFKIDKQGKISALKNHTLAKGVYIITIAAINTKIKKNIKYTSLTVTIT